MGGPAPAVAATRTAVRSALAGAGLGPSAATRTATDGRALDGPGPDGAPPPGGVLVACSGGADSLALAAATAFVTARLGVRAAAVVVDHGLHEGSGAVAERAAAQCRALGLEASVRAVRVGGAGGPEAAARDARYAALESARAEVGAAVVLLGHTLDDQAESVLLGLARGSGARSLSGMAARRGALVRPFLGLRRAQTEAACRAQGLPYWVDPTNGDPAVPVAPPPGDLPLRSRVRSRALPALADVLGPGVVPALARTANLLRDDADLLDSLAADLLDRAKALGVPGPGDSAGPDPADSADPPVVLDAGVLAAAHPALRRRALRRAAVEAGCPPGDLFAVHVDALDALVTRWRGQGPAGLPGARSGSRSYGRLFLRPPHPEE